MLDHVIQIIVDMFHNSSNDINGMLGMFQRIFTSTSFRMYMMYYMNESNERVYTMAKVDPRGNPTFSAHPARLSSISMNTVLVLIRRTVADFLLRTNTADRESQSRRGSGFF